MVARHEQTSPDRHQGERQLTDGYNPDDIAWLRNLEAIRLEQTCIACPEQYDAFVDGRQVGYLRLRHGHFRVHYPDVGGEIVYQSHPSGDGMFGDDERRARSRRI
jgi:hypothetical protein